MKTFKNTRTSSDGTGRHDCDGAASVIANTTTSAATAASRGATQQPPGGERCGSWCSIWRCRERHWRGRDDCRTHWQCASLCASPGQPHRRGVQRTPWAHCSLLPVNAQPIMIPRRLFYFNSIKLEGQPAVERPRGERGMALLRKAKVINLLRSARLARRFSSQS